jgi:hypothetical protein
MKAQRVILERPNLELGLTTTVSQRTKQWRTLASPNIQSDRL